MTGTAIALVLAAAFVHAGWNLLAKRLSGYDDIAYLWLIAVCSLVLYAPSAVAVIVVSRPHIGVEELTFMAGSGVLHFGYFMLLQRGYRSGDLSLVYPLARGTGPMLSSAFAIAFLGERPSAVAMGGIAAVGVGVFALGVPGRGSTRPSIATIAFGLSTGAIIAVYTIWDKHAVGTLAVPPLLYNWAWEVAFALVLAPMAASSRRRAEVRKLWARHRKYVLAAAVMVPGSYLLVLLALRFSTVSSIAPAREISVLIAVVLGGKLLAEGQLARRLPAALAITAGVVIIALG